MLVGDIENRAVVALGMRVDEDFMAESYRLEVVHALNALSEQRLLVKVQGRWRPSSYGVPRFYEVTP